MPRLAFRDKVTLRLSCYTIASVMNTTTFLFLTLKCKWPLYLKKCFCEKLYHLTFHSTERVFRYILLHTLSYLNVWIYVCALQCICCNWWQKIIEIFFSPETCPMGKSLKKIFRRCNIHRMENKGNNKITELRTILQRESQNS
jgi:hypothetical protein